jgi:hypothetical protein
MTAADVVPSTGFALESTPGPFLGGGNPTSLSGFGFATAPFGTPAATPGIGFSTFGQQALPFGTVAVGGGNTSSAPIPSPFGANSGGWAPPVDKVMPTNNSLVNSLLVVNVTMEIGASSHMILVA